MSRIEPFRGFRYVTEKVGDLGAVVTQPYDKIPQDLKARYLESSPYNFVRVLLAEDGDYEGTAKRLEDWTSEGVFTKEEAPCFYVYYQTFNVDGQEFTRKGFVGLGNLEDAASNVKPHEKTLSGPKADRLNLLRANNCYFGQIFMLYRDVENTVNTILDESAQGEPILDVPDEDGNRHRMWKLEDPEKVKAVQASMGDKVLFIADGHHRFETACTFREETSQAGKSAGAPEDQNHCMMTFVNMEDPGMVVLATHRVVDNLPGFNADGFFSAIADDFEVSEHEATLEGAKAVLADANVPTFAVTVKGSDTLYKLVLKNQDAMKAVNPSRADSYNTLDVSVLHDLLLAKAGLSKEMTTGGGYLKYIRGLEKALGYKDEAQMVFMMNPTALGQVEDAANDGESMPQKSTDFYPKLLSGLVFSKIDWTN